MKRELLTHSRQDCFKTCRRKHFYEYELGLRPIEDAKALRMGSAFHAGVEHLKTDGDLGPACDAVNAIYEIMPDGFDAYWWVIERETVLRLVCAYQWRWQSSNLEVIATEQAFEIPLINPQTGKSTPNFNLAGKIDGIVRLEDGRLAVKEMKTTSDDLGPDSPLWRRLRIDHQISLYIHAARQLGYAVDTVLYDVTRKPSIKPTHVPLVDSDGIKIVLDRDGSRVRNANKTWRQTSDTEKGYELQTRPMTIEEWGEKLTADIGERPDYYFARKEIARLNQDIDEYQLELWDIQKTIREAQKNDRWYRTVNRNTCQFCPHFEHCSMNVSIDPAYPPVGFEIVQDKHPELERSPNGSTTSTVATQTTTAPAATCAAVI